MKSVLATWKWSLAVIACSPLVLLALAVLVAVWGFGAYQWLYFPTESSGISFVLGIIWAIAQWAVLAAFLAASVASATSAAATGASSLGLGSLLGFSLRQLLRCAVFVILAALLTLLLLAVVHRVNHYSLEVASFLTFHSEKPVRPETVEKIFEVIEWLLWIVGAGFLLGFVCILVPQGWRAASRSIPWLLTNSCWRSSFLTTLMSFAVFGGLTHLLVHWHPKVSPGSTDYAQAVIRLGVALLLVVTGWLFWLLALARLGVPRSEGLLPDPHCVD